MLAEVGTFATALALAAVLYAAFALLRSIQSSDLRWAASGRNGIYAATTLLGLALVLLSSPAPGAGAGVPSPGWHSGGRPSGGGKSTRAGCGERWAGAAASSERASQAVAARFIGPCRYVRR